MNSSREQIEQIKERLDIVDVISKYVNLKQTGKNYSGLCPFHSEKTPSFIVSPELQRYKCFGCGEAGDIFNFVQKIENIDFVETLEKLAKEAGVKLIKKAPNTHLQRLEEINKKAAIYYYKQLRKHKDALEYIHERGITDQSIKDFGIGYAPGGFGLLDSIQKDSKYSKKELLLSGLFILKNDKLREKFFRRIMFPIRSSSGKVIAFTARVLPSNRYGPKYMNSPETPIYQKKNNLYGQYESRQQIRKDDLVILCEGQTDVIAAFQAGIKNIVAPLGTALTKEQLERISRLTKNILFIFDTDTAGQQALEKAFVLSQQLSLNTYATSTSPYKDIDELIKHEPKKIKEVISKKVDAYTFMLVNLLEKRDLNRLEDYQKTVSWMERMLSFVVNPTLSSFYVKSGLNLTKIDLSKKTAQMTRPKEEVECGRSPIIPQDLEVLFLQELLFQKDIEIDKNIKLKYFFNPEVKEILRYIKREQNLDREKILNKFDDNNLIKNLLQESIFSFSKEQGSKDELELLYSSIVKNYFKRKETEYGIKIASAEQMRNSKESKKLLEEFQKLTNEKRKYEENSRL